MRRLRLTILIIVLAALAGCAASHRRNSLTNTLNAYATTLRWGKFSQSVNFVDPTYRKAHPMTRLRLARYKQVQVVGYDAGQGPTPVSDTEVRQTVKIGLVNKHTQHERSIIDHQTWKWDPKADHWWLETGLPDITHGKRR